MQLNEAPSFTSGKIQRLLYEGRSANSGAFMIAAIRNEGLVRNVPGSLRCYERLDPTAWLLEVQQLIDSGISLSELDRPVQPVVVACLGLVWPTTQADSGKFGILFFGTVFSLGCPEWQ